MVCGYWKALRAILGILHLMKTGFLLGVNSARLEGVKSSSSLTWGECVYVFVLPTKVYISVKG